VPVQLFNAGIVLLSKVVLIGGCTLLDGLSSTHSLGEYICVKFVSRCSCYIFVFHFYISISTTKTYKTIPSTGYTKIPSCDIASPAYHRIHPALGPSFASHPQSSPPAITSPSCSPALAIPSPTCEIKKNPIAQPLSNLASWSLSYAWPPPSALCVPRSRPPPSRDLCSGPPCCHPC
jgi:hypothetical protein